MGNRKVHGAGSANAKCRRLWAADEPGRLEAGVCGEKQVEQQQQLPVPLAQVALHQQRGS